MIDTSQLTPEQLEVIEKYREIYGRVGSLKIRIEMLKQELTDSINEINELRVKEADLFKNIENNG
jgi:regulator of replication initiation timing